MVKLYLAQTEGVDAQNESNGHSHAVMADTPDAQEDNEASAAKALAGLRVLVIEDESLVAMVIEDMLVELGCRVISSVSGVQQAIDKVNHDQMDFAVLDVNLRGQPSYAVAEALQARGVPFIFVSGYGDVDERWRSRPVIQKPCEVDQLRREMERVLRGE